MMLSPIHSSTYTEQLKISENAKDFSKSVNAWAIDLYQDLAQVRNLSDKNFVFFTPNLLASFSMLYAGAPEKLQRIMEEALHMGEHTKDAWHNNFNNWSTNLMARSQQLKDDKPIFHFQQVQMLASHERVSLTENAARSLDFYKCENKVFTNASEVGPFINNRVEEVTEGIIKDLVSPGDLTGDLILLMASAALFKGQWEFPFEKMQNSVERFTNSDGSYVNVEMMNQSVDNLKMAYDSNKDQNYRIEILELPFHGEMSLLVMKPGSKNPKEQLKKFMNKETIQELLNNYDERFHTRSALTIGIPKLDLKEKTDVLGELGFTALAQGIKDANFDGTLVNCGSAVTTPKLVSEVHFMMDEEGAKVAGASYSPSYNESCDPYFGLDRSFGLAIIDRATQTILSMGQILKLEGLSKEDMSK